MSQEEVTQQTFFSENHPNVMGHIEYDPEKGFWLIKVLDAESKEIVRDYEHVPDDIMNVIKTSL